MDDEELKRAFGALREHDRSQAPAFARMRAQAERRTRTRGVRRGAILAAGFAIAAVILLAVWTRMPAAPAPIALAHPPEALGFLSAPPSASVLTTTAPIDQIGEAW